MLRVSLEIFILVIRLIHNLVGGDLRPDDTGTPRAAPVTVRRTVLYSW